jgi:glutamate synthase (NADPH/NADH) large chain
MSGGLAYIYKKELENVNQEMVDIDPLNEDDFASIKKALRDHLNFTSSNVADNVLENWDEAKERFIKVIPRDYKEVLRKQALENTKTLV